MNWQDDQSPSDGNQVRLKTVEFLSPNGVMSSRHLLARQLSVMKKRASQHGSKSSSSIPDVYIIVIVSMITFCFVLYGCFQLDISCCL